MRALAVALALVAPVLAGCGTGGGLEAVSGDISSATFPNGTVVAWHPGALRNRSDRTAVLLALTPVRLPRGMQVVDARTYLDAPQGEGNAPRRVVAGSVVAPARRAHGQLVRLQLRLRAPGAPRAGVHVHYDLTAVRVDYRIDGERHAVIVHAPTRICFDAPPLPDHPDCGYPPY